MADPERENAVERAAPPRIDQQHQADSRPSPAERPASPRFACAECGSPQLTLVKDAVLVAIYKCPACGNLTAPVKNR